MLSFLFLVALFSYCSSYRNYCGWFVSDDVLQPLQICQQERGTDGLITSYMTVCNQNNDQVLTKWWNNSVKCGDNNPPSTATHLTPSSFNCTECIFSSYLTYKAYSNNECSSKELFINNNDIMSDTTNANNENSINAPYYETTLITNECYNNTNREYYQLITCSNYSYSIHSYSDDSCNQLISTKVISNTNCQQIINCSNDIIISTTTTSYFTTTQLSVKYEAPCNNVNTMGYNIPTDKCLTISSTESQIYECNKFKQITWSYYSKSMNCSGNNSMIMNPYPLSAIIDWNCDSVQCSNNEYLELIVFKTENDCSIDAIDTNYDSHLYLINTCMKTQNGGSVIYTCINNKGYTITKYLDANCLTQDSEISYNEIECIYDKEFDPPPQRRQHMVFCNGINDVIIEKEKEDYIIDCNYFINNDVDPLGVISEPLNMCISIQHGSSLLYSKKYQCNKDKSFIEEIIYNGNDCIDRNIKSIISHYEFNHFYCDSQYSCHDSVLIGKQYTMDTCDQNHEQIMQFWHEQYIIIDKCWPVGNGLYTIISCDQNGFVYYSLYNDRTCQLLAFPLRFNIFDCIFGKLFKLLNCPHWKQQQQTTTTTTTTTTTITTTTTTTQPIWTSFTSTSILTSSISPSIYDNNDDIEHRIQPKEECINMFGGRDIGGVNCKYWEDIIWALIVLVAAIISCFICWCWCSHDAKSLRKQNSLFFQRKQSKLSVSNGNNNEDLQNIVIQQLNKGQHVNANKNNNQFIQLQQVENDDEKYDEIPFSL